MSTFLKDQVLYKATPGPIIRKHTAHIFVEQNILPAHCPKINLKLHIKRNKPVTGCHGICLVTKPDIYRRIRYCYGSGFYAEGSHNFGTVCSPFFILKMIINNNIYYYIISGRW